MSSGKGETIEVYIAHIAQDGRIQTCREHSRNTAEKAEYALNNIGLSKTAYLAGLLHDAGKFTVEFTDYIQNAVQGSARRGSVIHSFAGGSFLLDRYHAMQNDQLGIRDLTAEIIACAVISHHGLVDLISEDGKSGFEHRKTKQPEYDHRALKAFLQECASENEVDVLFQDAVQEIANLLNRLPRTEDYSENLFYMGFLARMLTSAVVSGDREDTAGFMAGTVVNNEKKKGTVWEKPLYMLEQLLSSFPEEGRLQLARKAFSDQCCLFAVQPSGIYRLDLPTGSGKTLCALRFALKHAEVHKKNRIIYTAPLLSIIEQNASVIRKAVGDDSLVLEHHSNLVDTEEDEDLKNTELLQESWDSPIIVTTMVRLLEVMFSGKMADVRRLQALCNSVLILDEVQSIPPKMISMFNCAVNFLSQCCQTTVVLCSATQPPFNQAKHSMCISEKRMIEPAMLAKAKPLFKRTELQYGGRMTTESLLQYISDSQKESTSLLVVCNTKSEATELFHGLNGSKDNVCFLSAGMCTAHRKKALKHIMEMLESHEPMICVSTQVIEAGIDISFDAVVRMSAGLDSVVQCAGRCNRNGEYPDPQPVRIVTHADQRLGPLRDIIEQQNALNDLIAEYQNKPDAFGRDLASEESVTYYYKSLFRNMRKDAQDYPVEHVTLYSLLSTNEGYLGVSREQGKYGLNQAFKTAAGYFSVFNEENKSILVPYEEGVGLIGELECAWGNDNISRCWQILKEAKAYSLSVTKNQLDQLKQINAVRSICDNSIWIAESWCYDEKTGLLSGNMLKERMEKCSTLIL